MQNGTFMAGSTLEFVSNFLHWAAHLDCFFLIKGLDEMSWEKNKKFVVIATKLRKSFCYFVHENGILTQAS